METLSVKPEVFMNFQSMTDQALLDFIRNHQVGRVEISDESVKLAIHELMGRSDTIRIRPGYAEDFDRLNQALSKQTS